VLITLAPLAEEQHTCSPSYTHTYSTSSSSLPPLSPNPHQRTHRARESHNPIIQIHPSQRTSRNRNIAEITQQLHLDRIQLPLQLLRLDDFLRVYGGGDGFGALEKIVIRVKAGGEGEGETGEPGAVAFAEETGGICGFTDRGCVELCCCCCCQSSCPNPSPSLSFLPLPLAQDQKYVMTG
jgi:hypothetical protein